MNMISTTGLKPRRCRADSETHDRGFADRRVDHPIRAKLFSESFSDAERAAEGDVFAENVDGRIAAHFLCETGADGLKIGLFRHCE